YMTIYRKLTLKQLSNFLNKGKTTIHHHIRKLEDGGIVKWEERDEDKKKLKTRYYSINIENLLRPVEIPSSEEELAQLSESEKLDILNSTIEWMKTDALIVNSLLDWLIKFIENQFKTADFITVNKQGETFIKTLRQTRETLLEITKELLIEKDRKSLGYD
ncbi:MAG: winged helix-turn-helix domain-containing protein, partial [Promethearchaeota archaeon]